MSVTPKVYEFAPGAKTGQAFIDGVKRVMEFTLGTHHWEVVPGSYSPGVNASITLRDKLTQQLRLRLVSVTAGTPNPTIDCFFSRDGGATESVKCWLSGGSTIYEINDPSYGMSIDEAYVIEIEDAITIVSAVGNIGPSAPADPAIDRPTSLVANALSMGVHAGRIFSAHNKSDSATGAGEHGMICGQLMVYTSSPWAMLSGVTGSGGGAANGAQGVIWNGSAFVTPRIADVPVSAVTAEAATQWRDSRTTTATYTKKLIENVGDNQSIERLVPYPVSGPTSGTGATGHMSYTRYLRARKYGYGDTAGGTVIDNTTVLQSTGDPNIGWRHNWSFSLNELAQKNTIHIWCPPGAEIEVP